MISGCKGNGGLPCREALHHVVKYYHARGTRSTHNLVDQEDHGAALTLCAYMKKGPNLRWSLIQCSGGDEGDRTPDLLTASQALSQLSYAPVRKSTIRELGRRCKDIFGKFRSRGAGRHPPNGRLAGARPITGANRAPADPAISKLCRFTGPGREPPSMP